MLLPDVIQKLVPCGNSAWEREMQKGESMENPTTEKISPGDIIYFEPQEGQRVLACVLDNCGKILFVQGMGHHCQIVCIQISQVVGLYKPIDNWLGKE